jgi:Holliday junction resolvase RusA-like endonuclease
MSGRERMARFSSSSSGQVRVERKALGAAGTITLALPFPPPSNNLFEEVPGGARTRTKRYREWREAAHKAIDRQRPRLAVGAVEVMITLEEGPGRHGADNRIKAVLDCLVEKGIIAAGHSGILRRVTAQWGDVQGVRVEVTKLS